MLTHASLRLQTWATALAALGWSLLVGVFVAFWNDGLRWIVYGEYARAFGFTGLLLMLAWPSVRMAIPKTLARVFLGLFASYFGVLLALLLVSLRTTGFFTLLGLAVFTTAAVIGVGAVIPVSLRQPRRVMTFLRDISELLLLAVGAWQNLSWLETLVTVVGLAAVLTILGDDAQNLRLADRVVPSDQRERFAAVSATDLYLSFFRVTVLFLLLRTPRRKK